VLSGATATQFGLSRIIKRAITDEKVTRDLKEHGDEIARLRDWRHNILTPWQQTLMEKLDERFVTRREWDEARRDDSPWPNNRRKNPR
jgi:hypothetical protein